MTGRPVVVPDALRGPVWRALAGDIRRACLVDGAASVRPDLLAFLEALRHAEAEQDAAETSASGSRLAQSGTVWLTTHDVAQALECSDRHARTIAARIGTRTGRQWLVAAADLDRWRFPQ